jgi:hypothetical protein
MTTHLNGSGIENYYQINIFIHSTHPIRSILLLLPVEDLEGRPDARLSQIPILLRTVFAQSGEQLWNVDIVVVVEVAKPPAKHVKKLRIRREIERRETCLCLSSGSKGFFQ